jgi:hypothetical protein
MRLLAHVLGMAAWLAMLALVAGCAATPPHAAAPHAAPPPAYPASVRDRLVRIALAEWEDWGRPFIDHTGPAAAAPLADRHEQDTEAFPAVLAYWSAVPGREGTIADAVARFRAAAPAWAEVPWSAAFVSFVVRAAGYDRADIPSADAHWRIVDHLMAREAAWPEEAAFAAHAPHERAPMPGDILCAARGDSRGRYARPEDRAAEAGRPVPMHCDVVVGVRPGVVEVVGGNVGDSVRMALLPAEADGRLARAAAAGAPELPAWFVLFENRAGR